VICSASVGSCYASRIAAVAALCLASIAAAQAQPPSIDRQVQPVWGPELEKDYLVVNTRVELIVDARGVPFSVVSSGGLPDNVVEALEKWKFNPGKKDGKDVPFSVVLNLPIRNALTPASVRQMRRRWFAPTRELDDAIRKGFRIDEATVGDATRSLTADPQNLNARATLLAYSSTASGGVGMADQWKARAEQIAWLAENQPAAPVLGSPLSTLACDGTGADRATCDRVESIWKTQLASKPAEAVLLEHATNFLRIADPPAAETALVSLGPKIDGAGLWLGDLYGLAVLGVAAVDPKTGLASAAGDKLPETPFAKKARAALSTATNVRLVFSGLNAIAMNGRALARSGRVPDGFSELCMEILNHANQLYSSATVTCSTASDERDAQDSAAVERIRVGGNVQAAVRIKQVTPTYPLEAKSRGIQGVIQFEAVIDKQGKVQSLVLLSGPIALYKSARDAVSQWEYHPTQLNGRPVEVLTRLEVNYTLSGR
jgi:hypothetical protein